MNKIYESAASALADVTDGSSIMMLSFVGPTGVPQDLISGLVEKGVKDLTIVATANLYYPGGNILHPEAKPYVSARYLVAAGQVKKIICAWGKFSYMPDDEKDFWKGREENLELEFMPMGVMAHRIRCAGAAQGGYYSAVGPGTWYSKGKETRIIDGKEYVLEYPLRADIGFIRARKADTLGNVFYHLGERMFSPLIAKACPLVIAEVDEIVEPGAIAPDVIHTPGIYVDRIVQTTRKTVWTTKGW